MKLLLMLLPFLIAGCFGCDPDCDCPEQTMDDFVWSLSPADDGGVLLVGSRFTHDVGDEIGPLDCSCPGNYENPFQVSVAPTGYDQWRSTQSNPYTGEVARAAAYHDNEIVTAGYVWRSTDRDVGWIPSITVKNAERQQVRWAILDDEFFAFTYDWGYESPVNQPTAVITPDGGAVYWGEGPTGGNKLVRASGYGEKLWERDVSFSPASATMHVLATGEILVVEWSGVVRLLSSDGVQIWERRVGSSHASPHSGMQLSGTGYSISGSVTSGTESNPMVWHLDPTGVVLDSVEVDYPGCQDSVRIVMSWLDDEILVCRHREGCGADNKVLLMRLSSEGDTLSTFLWGATGNTIPRCVAVPETGDLYVAAMSNAPTGNAGDNYSVVLAKFSSTLHLLWTMRI